MGLAAQAPEVTADMLSSAVDATEPPDWEAPLGFNELTGEPFPEDIFPDQIEQFVRAQAHALQTPVDLPAVLALGVIAAASARRAEVSLSPDWIEPLNEWFAIVLSSGERKSPQFRAITAPVEERQRELVEARRPEIERQKVDRDIKEKRVAELKSRAAKADGIEANQPREEAARVAQELDEAPVPVLPRLIADDVTSEAVAGLLAEQGGRIAILSAEGGLFATIAGRYSDGVANLDVFLKGYSGDSIRVDRRGRQSEFVPKPHLTLCLTVQPQVIESFSEQREFRGRGFLARFNFSFPQSVVGYRESKVAPVPEELARNWARSVNPNPPNDGLGDSP